MQNAWYLDELEHAGPEHLDAAFVAKYEQKQGHPDPTPDLAVLDGHGVLGRTVTLVDIGAGTGQFAVAAAPHCQRVIAVDVSTAMLAYLRARAAAAGVTNVQTVRAGFLTYEHIGAGADTVYTRNALHQLPDFWKVLALDRIARVLRPGGVLRLRDLIFDFRPADAQVAIESWMNGAAKDPEYGYTHDELATHVRTEHSTYRWLLEPMLDAAGFEIIQTDFNRSVYGAYTCVKR